MKTVVGLFDRFSDAANAVREIESIGIERNRSSMIANRDQAGRWPAESGGNHDHSSHNGNGSAAGAAVTGAVVGGVAGLIAGLVAFIIPGIGSLLGVGPLVTALTGAGVGVAAGGLLGTLVDAGVSHDDAEAYTEGVRRGGTLLAVAAGATEVDHVTQIMDKHNPVNIERRTAEWRLGGWSPAAAVAASAAGANGSSGTYVAGAATPILHGHSDAAAGVEAGRIDRIHEKRERPRPERQEREPAFARSDAGADLSASLPPHLGEFGTTVDAPTRNNMTGNASPAGASYRTGANIPNPGQAGERGPHHLSSSSPETTMVGRLDNRLAYLDPADVQALRDVEPSRGTATVVVATEGNPVPPLPASNGDGAPEDRVELVQVTSRRMDMEPGADKGSEFDRYEDEFRQDFESRRSGNADGNGTHPGADYTFDEAKAAYRHGCELACDCKDDGAKDWKDVEPEARRRWEQRSNDPGSWDQIKHAARYAYDVARTNK